MNCKPGDLAINTNSVVLERVGALVDVIRPTGGDPRGEWVIEWRGKQFVALDRYLIPIRDNPGDDETLTWAGKPEKVTA